jgi:hypothetical protein
LEFEQPSESTTKVAKYMDHPLNEPSNPGFIRRLLALGLRHTHVRLLGLQLGITVPRQCESMVHCTQPPE